MIVQVWSWNAKPGKAGAATAYCKKVVEMLNSQNMAASRVLRPKNGDMMKVFLSTEAESMEAIDANWAKLYARDDVGPLMKEHNEVFDQNTSRCYQYNVVT